jgi:hypothetical protein
MGQRGDVDAPKLLGEALALRPRVTNLRTIANVLTLLLIGSISGVVEEDLREVARLHEEALTGFRESGYVWGIFTCLTNVGLIRLALGDNERAEGRFRELLPLSQEADDKIARHHAVFGLACVAARSWSPFAAATTLGSVLGRAGEIGGTPAAHHALFQRLRTVAGRGADPAQGDRRRPGLGRRRGHDGRGAEARENRRP